MYWIWLIYDEWLCRYEWWSEITKWRLDDVMVGWSGWKGYCIHSSSGQRYCENLKMIAHSVFEISWTQNSWDLTFDLHLHSQDGLMSTWCYYVIWLADHITYAYKIWARFDQWFLRYKTKGMCVWACVRVCDIQRWEWVKICMCGHTFA